MTPTFEPAPLVVRPLIEAALREDLSGYGDITTRLTVPADRLGEAELLVKQSGVVYGLSVFAETFRIVDPSLTIQLAAGDGSDVQSGQVIATISGSLRSILTAERTALNFAGHLSGIATTTADMARRIAHTKAHVVCTRKTTPGLRLLEKAAVQAGGGRPHRFGLGDGVLIKDNHIAAAGGVRHALEAAKANAGHLMAIEIEVTDLGQLAEVIDIGADAVLLDNMSLDQLREAVTLVAGRMTTEASGGIRPETAASVAETGVDLLSVGFITHSAPSLDLSLNVRS